MKLYTEEQVKQIVEKSRETGLTAEYLMLTTPPKEQPLPTISKTEKVQTAVEWLVDWLMDNPITSDGYIEAMIKAKQMEKEQIVDAWHSSHVSMMTGEQYYNETYGK